MGCERLPGDAELVQCQDPIIASGGGQAIRTRRRTASPHPGVEVRHGGIEHVVLLGAGVDERCRLLTHHLVSGRDQSGQFLCGERAVVPVGADQAVGVEVSRPGDLP